MKKIKKMLEEMEEKDRKVVERSINSVARLLRCNVDWKEFYVYKEYEPIILRMLENDKSYYIVAAALAIEDLDEKPSKVNIAVAIENSDTIAVLPKGKNGSRTVVIPITLQQKRRLLL